MSPRPSPRPRAAPIRPTIALLVLWAPVACTATPDDVKVAEEARPTPTVDTVGGVPVVRNAATPYWREGEAWTLREDWRLGGADAPPPEVFGNALTMVSVGPNGNVYAAPHGRRLGLREPLSVSLGAPRIPSGSS